MRKRYRTIKRARVDKFRHYDLVIYASRASHSARKLAAALGCRRWRDDLPTRYTRRRPYFRGNRSPMVINWGSTRPAEWLNDPRFRLTPKWINPAEACSRAIDKREFFRVFSDVGRSPTGDKGAPVRVLRATTDRNEAEKWLKKGHKIVARRNLTGSGGSGITICDKSLVDAPLYTRYFPKTHEFRVHVWNGKMIDFTQKKLRGGPSDTANRTIRSLDNGWIHAHDDLSLGPADIEVLGKSAASCISSLGLYFGCVDILGILDNGRLRDYRICEVNTGPGLENTETINAYSKAILQAYTEARTVKHYENRFL